MPMGGYAEHFQSIGTTDVFFSQNGGATATVVSGIHAAKSEIIVQAYSFTSVSNAKTLVEARNSCLINILSDGRQP